MACYFVISDCDDPSTGEVRLIDGFPHPKDVRVRDDPKYLKAWWALVREILPNATDIDAVHVTSLKEVVKRLVEQGEWQFEPPEDSDLNEPLKAERASLLATVAKLIALAQSQEVRYLYDRSLYNQKKPADAALEAAAEVDLPR